jgi:hypothetical protein
MNKISGNSTFFYKYIFPFLYGGVYCLIAWMLSNNLIIVITVFLLVSIINLLSFSKLSEVFISYEKEEFYIINSRKKYYYKFSELKEVKPLSFINIVKLKFEKNTLLFTPAGVEFPDYKNVPMINELKGIARQNEKSGC